MYRPRVAGAMTHQPVKFLNHDPALHNFLAASSRENSFNFSLPDKGRFATRRLHQSEVMIQLSCSLHTWMRGYLGVLDHPCFAVTLADGSFLLKGVPAGEYTLEAWHEKLGTQTKRITVEAGKTAETEFTFGP
jgi:hypothetical protein